MPLSISLAMTGLISVSSSTRSPMTIAPPWTGLNAVQPPSARVGRMVTPSSVTLRSLRGNPLAVHVTGYGGAPSNRFIDFLPVDLLGLGGAADCRHGTNRKYLN